MYWNIGVASRMLLRFLAVIVVVYVFNEPMLFDRHTSISALSEPH